MNVDLADTLRASPSAIRFSLCHSFEELLAAYRLVYTEYVRKGFERKDESKLRFHLFDLLPCSVTMVAVSNGRVLGTASASEPSRCRLPAAKIFPEAVHSLQIQDRRILESTKFACAKSLHRTQRAAGRSVIASGILRLLFQWCHRIQIDDWLIIVHPSHADYYIHTFGFDMLANDRDCSHVQGAPGVLLRLNLQLIREKAQHVPLAGLEILEPREDLHPAAFSGYRLDSNDIRALLSLRPDVLPQASEGEREALRSVYGDSILRPPSLSEKAA